MCTRAPTERGTWCLATTVGGTTSARTAAARIGHETLWCALTAKGSSCLAASLTAHIAAASTARGALLRSSAARVWLRRMQRGDIPPRPLAARTPAGQAERRGPATAIGHATSGSVRSAPGALSIPSTAHGATAEAAHMMAATITAARAGCRMSCSDHWRHMWRQRTRA